jgi:hypothetical protein
MIASAAGRSWQNIYMNTFSQVLAALSAGIEVGERINDRACAMLSYWGIDAAHHKPRRIDRALRDRANAKSRILHILLYRFGMDLSVTSSRLGNVVDKV